MEVADRLAILDVLHGYGHAYDSGDWSALGDVFTIDACFEVLGTVGQMPSVLRGRDGIVAAMRSRRDEIAPAQRRHISTNVVIRAGTGGADARAGSYLLLASTNAGRVDLLTAGRYDDELRRDDDGRWRIASRRVTIDADMV